MSWLMLFCLLEYLDTHIELWEWGQNLNMKLFMFHSESLSIILHAFSVFVFQWDWSHDVRYKLFHLCHDMIAQKVSDFLTLWILDYQIMAACNSEDQYYWLLITVQFIIVSVNVNYEVILLLLEMAHEVHGLKTDSMNHFYVPLYSTIKGTDQLGNTGSYSWVVRDQLASYWWTSYWWLFSMEKKWWDQESGVDLRGEGGRKKFIYK